MTQCCRKKSVGKPCEGEPHARFDEGKEGLRPLTYSTISISYSGSSSISLQPQEGLWGGHGLGGSGFGNGGPGGVGLCRK